jgi:rod shape-determining protein MreC
MRMMVSSTWSLRASSSFLRLLFFVTLSCVLMVADQRGHQLEKIRATLVGLFYPVQILATLPADTASWASDYFRSSATLRDEVGALRAEQQTLLAKVQKYDALEADNAHLRELLGAAERVADRATVAQLINVSPEPFTRKIVIAKGSDAGLFVGQAVIDAYGVMGQVSEVDKATSRVTLITDPSHSVPVQVVRNGLRTILLGTGGHDYVEAPYLTASADIQEGDVFVTSGLGGVFPAGYPVARVLRIIKNPNEPFLKIIARPLAHLESTTDVMLIWTRDEHAAPARK